MDEMDDSLMLMAMQQLTTADALRRCNTLSERYGLTLSETEIAVLVQARSEALQASGRVELGEGILPKLIEAFCDSPYLTQQDYADTLAELLDSFYWFKNDSEESISDDELIEAMRQSFNGPAHGSIEYMEGTSLTELCRAARDARYGVWHD